MKTVLLIHGIITLSAGFLLVLKPEAIPGTVNIRLSENSYLLCYFLAASEISIAYLSFAARRINDVRYLRIVLNSFIIFHLCTAGLEAYAVAQGASQKIIINVLFRIIIAAIFVYFGYARKSRQ